MNTKIGLIVSISIVLYCLTVRAADMSGGFKVGGFVDAQFHTAKANADTDGFTFHDGALYVDMTSGTTAAKIDLPFKANFAGDTTADGANVAVGNTKTQAYITHGYDFGLSWKLGQFDSPFGFEPNDSPDITFSRQGLVDTLMMPVVHAGLLLSYKVVENIMFHAIAANQRDQGAYRATNYDLGGQLAFNNNQYRATGGILYGKLAGNTYTLLDFLAGATFGDIAVDGEFTLRKNAVASAVNQTGILGQVAYAFNDNWSFAGKVEFGMKLSTADGSVDDKLMQISAGPQYSMNKNVKVKIDFTDVATTPVGGTATHAQAYVVSTSFKM